MFLILFTFSERCAWMNAYQADFVEVLILMIGVLIGSLFFYQFRYGNQKAPQLFDHPNLNEQRFNLGWETSTVTNGIRSGFYARVVFGVLGIFMVIVVLLAALVGHPLISSPGVGPFPW